MRQGKEQKSGPRKGRRRGGGRRARRSHWGDGPVYAAVDLGTNNCRLLMARPTRRGFRVIGSFSKIVRLGEGLNASDQLSENAMQRTIGALEICAEKMKAFGVAKSRSVATQACRQAANCRAFIDRVEDRTGLEFETISFEEEARLAVAGCRSLFHRGTTHALVFDIGGGSTEMTWVSHTPGGQFASYEILDVLSLPYGVVTMSESCGGDVTEAEYESLVTEIVGHLAAFEAQNRIAERIAEGATQMLGTSGTVTTLGAVHLGLPHYSRPRIDGLDVRFDDLVDAGRRLAAMDYQERVAQPCIGEERAELVVPGAAILEAIRETWPAKSLRIADRGLREGMLIELIAADRSPVDQAPQTPTDQE